jgi:hypothetical protein
VLGGSANVLKAHIDTVSMGHVSVLLDVAQNGSALSRKLIGPIYVWRSKQLSGEIKFQPKLVEIKTYIQFAIESHEEEDEIILFILVINSITRCPAHEHKPLVKN